MSAPELQNVEIPRDRYGRPMVLAPNSKTKRVAYQRVTTFVGVLENTYNLMAWKQRQTALGMGMRKDLVLAAAAADPNDKKLLNEIAEKACEHALSSAGATTGTALHSLTERVDRGQQLGYVPAEYAADIKAYQDATEGIEWFGIEAFRVHDDWKIAGTADRLGREPGRDRLRVFDIKTGSIDYPHKMAMQLAMYARSIPYDVGTDKRGTDPAEIDLNTGIIIHLPAGEGRCDLYEIDIGAGWGACLIAKQVWKWRNEKDLTHRVGDDRETVWEKSNAPSRTREAAPLYQVERATTLDELRAIWRAAKADNALTSDFRAAAQKRSEELAASNTK